MNIATWLDHQLKAHDMNALGLSYAIGVSDVTIGKWLKGTYTPSPANCRRLAHYFNVPERDVMIIAGHLSSPTDSEPDTVTEPGPSYATDPALAEVLHIFSRLDDDQQRQLLAIMRTFQTPTKEPSREP